MAWTSPVLADGPEGSQPRVRTTDERLAEILEAGIERSETLRELVAALQRSNVIVYITPQAPARNVVYGELHFMASSAGVRYLRVAVRQDLSRAQVTAMIAHELQHALEVAAAAEVVDDRSMAALYWSIGYRLGSSHETAGALLAADRVLDELTAASDLSVPAAEKH
jgi:hypothetical protein